MAINEWWSARPAERYWMEITDRENLGDNLIAPTLAKGGKETFSYSLVSHVQPGDVVFHWWSRPGRPPAIVGHSTVAGDWFLSEITWEAHGTYSGGVRTSEAFEASLTDFTPLTREVTLEDLRRRESDLRRIYSDLTHSTKGALYFPWAFSDKRPMRTTQGYLVKVPADVVEVISELKEARKPKITSTYRGTRGLARQQDPEVRRAVERHAVDWTLNYFKARGCLVEDVGAVESFDVLVVTPDGREIHVEVKGSSIGALAVELTDGEVKHWGDEYERALVVVDGIRWSRSKGAVATSGGTPRLWLNWEVDPTDHRLVPTRYRYTLPGGGDDHLGEGV